MRIRAGTPADRPVLRRIAVASKGHWSYGPEFLARFAAVIVPDDDYVTRRDVRVLDDGGTPIGFSAILHGGVAVLDDLWVVPEHIGSGIGAILFDDAVSRAAARGATRMEWEAEPYAVGFYERQGATVVGRVTSELGRETPVMRILLVPASPVEAP